mmetsp:Transcript_80394/g.126817  ORF Transcript_80394/g.126817 Transcript_80394/m.126817 type:complete len:107 (+) Transcript_80394:42-362(+)
MALPLQLVGEGKVLFRSILRMHRTKLPEKMRALGDPYVRKEFRLHYKPDVTDKYRSMFIKQWNEYLETLSTQVTVVGKEMSEEQRSKLDATQRKQVEDLEKHAKAL